MTSFLGPALEGQIKTTKLCQLYVPSINRGNIKYDKNLGNANLTQSELPGEKSEHNLCALPTPRKAFHISQEDA